MVPVRSYAVMNLQPDGATAVISVSDPRRCLRFERQRFEQNVGGARRRSPLTHLKSALNRLESVRRQRHAAEQCWQQSIGSQARWPQETVDFDRFRERKDPIGLPCAVTLLIGTKISFRDDVIEERVAQPPAKALGFWLLALFSPVCIDNAKDEARSGLGAHLNSNDRTLNKFLGLDCPWLYARICRIAVAF